MPAALRAACRHAATSRFISAPPFFRSSLFVPDHSSPDRNHLIGEKQRCPVKQTPGPPQRTLTGQNGSRTIQKIEVFRRIDLFGKQYGPREALSILAPPAHRRGRRNHQRRRCTHRKQSFHGRLTFPADRSFPLLPHRQAPREEKAFAKRKTRRKTALVTPCPLPSVTTIEVGPSAAPITPTAQASRPAQRPSRHPASAAAAIDTAVNAIRTSQSFFIGFSFLCPLFSV